MRINKVLSLFVATFGVTVLFGWFFNIETLKCVANGWDSMMPVTAMLFLFTGMFLFCEQEENTCPVVFRENVLVVIAGVTCVTLWWQGVVILAKLVGHSEFSRTANDLLPYLPSMVTSMNFFAIFLHSLFLPTIKASWPRRLVVWTLATTSFSAIMGYIFNIPILYFKYEFFTAMAFHTAILFGLCGFVIARSGSPAPKTGKKIKLGGLRGLRFEY